MEFIRYPLLLFTGFLSFVPVIRLYQSKQDGHYQALRHFTMGIFTWTIVMFLIFLTENMRFLYYFTLILYPIIYFISYLGLLTIQSFINQKTPKALTIFAYVFLIINIIMALTNPLHLSYRTISPSEVTSREVMINAGSGWFFYLHTAISYIFMTTIVIKLLIYLMKIKKKATVVPFYLVLFSVFIGATLNIIHVFFYPFFIDPSYLFFVYFTYILYFVIFQRDFRLALISTSRKLLINSMREMYIIANDEGDIIEYSSDLDKHFKLTQSDVKKLDSLMKRLHEQAILYLTFDLVKNRPYDKTKRYYYYSEKAIKLKRYKVNGKLILLYDETRLMQLVDNLNFLRTHDQMTQLYNRNYFEETKDEFENACSDCGLLVLDLNGLKLTNDYLGHKAGDDLIIRFSNHLKNLENSFDNLLIIRFGGDEFLILTKHASLKRLKTIKETLLNEISHKDLRKHISVSIGYALRKDQENLEKTIKRADKLLYKEKEMLSKSYKAAYLAYLEKNNNRFD
ncbi:MAG: diguanylate cyclase domain-containing protein [Candidatus Izemoplasmataceae bacterium]